jgi:hypothetical protein
MEIPGQFSAKIDTQGARADSTAPLNGPLPQIEDEDRGVRPALARDGDVRGREVDGDKPDEEDRGYGGRA